MGLLPPSLFLLPDYFYTSKEKSIFEDK